MKKHGLIISSLLVTILSASLIAGATYSLFTSESKNNIAVNAGTVNVQSTIKEESLALSSLDVAQTNNTFANGGTAKLDKETGKKIVLSNITPGDAVSFKLNIKNLSTVAVKYSVEIVKKDDFLSNKLVLTGPAVNEWTELATSADIDTSEYTLTFPNSDNSDNDVQGLSSSISIVVKAIQANAVSKPSITIHYGNNISDVKIEQEVGTEVKKPEIFNPKGKMFVGFYTTPTYEQGSEYTFTTMPDKPLNIYAKYVDSIYKFRFRENSYSFDGYIPGSNFDSERITIVPEYYDDGVNGKLPVTIISQGLSLGQNKNLEEVILPSTLKTVEFAAFSYSNIKRCIIPEGVTRIYQEALSCCNLLEEVVLPNSLTSISDNMFASSSSLKKVTFGNAVTEIGASAFSNTTALQELTLPESLITLGDSAFQSSGIKKLYVSKNLTNVGEGAFFATKNLKVCVETEEQVSSWNPNFDMDQSTTLRLVFGKENFNDDKTYNITFDSNGGSSVDSKSFLHGKIIGNLPVPTYANHKFKGWTDATNNRVYKWMPNKDITLKANWEVKTYTITFDTNHGNEIKALTGKFGDTVTKPKNPARDGSEFEGWYTSSSFRPETKVSDFATLQFDSNYTLYAKYINNRQVKITLNPSGGTLGQTTVDREAYSSIYNLPEPTKEGFIFNGWYLDSGLSQKCEFVPANSTTLYADWKSSKVNVEFVSFIPGSDMSMEVNSESKFEIPDINEPMYEFNMEPCPTTGQIGMHRFMGWEYNGTTYQPGDYVSVSEDASFIAVWLFLE